MAGKSQAAELQPPDGPPGACALCGKNINADVPYVASRCSHDSCDWHNTHEECSVAYVATGRGERSRAFNTRRIDKLRETAKRRPAAALVTKLCVVGRGKLDVEECTGTIQVSHYMNEVKKEKAPPPQLPKPPHPAKLSTKGDAKTEPGKVKADAAKAKPASVKRAKDAPAAKPVQPTPNAEQLLRLEQRQAKVKAQEQLKQLARHQQPDKKATMLSHNATPWSHTSTTNGGGAWGSTTQGSAVQLNQENEEEGGGWEIMPSRRKGRSKAGHEVVQEEEPVVITEEIIEAAVAQGQLSHSYHTVMCEYAAQGLTCAWQSTCEHAHSAQELRAQAAIDLGKLPEDFKTRLCEYASRPGACPQGILCCDAHSVPELRVATAIRLGRLSTSYKTRLCAVFEAACRCPHGVRCQDAHGQAELRREAAVQAGLLSDNYKFLICRMFVHNSCKFGDACTFAHGVHDVRLHAAINARQLPASYKTQPCTKAGCDQATECLSYHSNRRGQATDCLPGFSFKDTFCSIHKETGACQYDKECFFAHFPEELQVSVPEDIASLSKPHLQPAESEAGASYDSDARPQQHQQQQYAQQAQPVKQQPKPKPKPQQQFPPDAIVPLAVQQNRLPFHPVNAAQLRDQEQDSDDAELTLCSQFMELGQCRNASCKYAHGQDELNQRKARRERGERQGPAPQRGSEPVWMNTASRFAADAAKQQRKLSAPVIDAIRTFRVRGAISQLTGMGFTWEQANAAAQACHGNFESSLQLLLDGSADEQEDGAAHNDTEVAHAVAASLNVDIAVIEATIMEHDGNIELAMEEVQRQNMQPASPVGSFEEVPSHAWSQDLQSARSGGSLNTFSARSHAEEHDRPATASQHSVSRQASLASLDLRPLDDDRSRTLPSRPVPQVLTQHRPSPRGERATPLQFELSHSSVWGQQLADAALGEDRSEQSSQPRDSALSNASISQLYTAASDHAPVTPAGHDLPSFPSGNLEPISSSQPAAARAPPGFAAHPHAVHAAPVHNAPSAQPEDASYLQQADWSSRPQTADSFVSGQSLFSNQSSFQQHEQAPSHMTDNVQGSHKPAPHVSQPAYDTYAPTSKLAELGSEPEPTFDDLYALLTS